MSSPDFELLQKSPLHKDVLTYRNPNPKTLAPEKFPPGFVYVENFFSVEEQSRILDIIDAHAFTKEIVRQQQFYGPVYYFTPQALRSSLQPVDTGLSSDVVGEVTSPSTSEATTTPDSGTSSDERSEEQQHAGHSDPNHPSDMIPPPPKVVNHELDPLQWVIDKLMAAGLFERADPKDPFVEYVSNPNGDGLVRVERDYSQYFHDKHPGTQHEHEVAKQKISSTHQQQQQQQEQYQGEETNQQQDCIMDSLPAQQNGKIDSTDKHHSEHDLQSKSEEQYPWGEASLYPDQILVNEYLPYLSIGAHFDDALSFGPIILGISLGADSTLVLSKPGCLAKADAALRQQQEQPDGARSAASSCGASSVQDIEDLGNDYCSIAGEDISYPLSLRDFSKPNWKVGKGPEILSQYCRCTREKLLLDHHQYGRELLTLGREDNRSQRPRCGSIDSVSSCSSITSTPDAATMLNEQNTLDTDGGCDDDDNAKSSHSAKMRRRRQFLKRMEAELLSHYPNMKKPTTVEEMEEFIFSYDYHQLLKQSDVSNQHHASSATNTHKEQQQCSESDSEIKGGVHNSSGTSQHIGQLSSLSLGRNGQLQSQNVPSSTSSTTNQPPAAQPTTPFVFDFTPSLAQINQCKNPVESIEIPVAAGSVYILSGAARYQYRHAIKKMPKRFCEEHPDYRRISLTVRSLLPGRRQVAENSDVDVTYQNHLFHFSTQTKQRR